MDMLDEVVDEPTEGGELPPYDERGHELTLRLCAVLELDPTKLIADGLAVHFNAEGMAHVQWRRVVEVDGKTQFEERQGRLHPKLHPWEGRTMTVSEFARLLREAEAVAEGVFAQREAERNARTKA
jgi:hypothetical protein